MRGEAILVVDEDFGLREKVEDALAEVGYEVDWACDEREAREYLDRSPRPAMIVRGLPRPFRAADLLVRVRQTTGAE